ncbi:unnamed protein product [Brachionus calyciflorus]|uniref:Uncharacterized protein n=1 Tax=Brachionus calyciflorus TaxID=104777 RepID=A0A813UA57_9BILA|nr:unnamed protein product [Brachionus calyciflorus]
MNKEIVEFSNKIRTLITHSDRVTKSAVQSITSLQSEIDQQDRNVNELIKIINSKKQLHENLDIAIKELDAFINLCNSIESDKMNIQQGPKGSVTEYIVKLEYLKTVDKYLWYKDLKFPRKKSKRNEENIQKSLDKHETLLQTGENYICFEFQNILKHNCNPEQMKYYIEFLIEKFSIKKDDVNSLFIPVSTVKKLELICSWFLKREIMYELYDESNQHCDINQKLKFDLIRFKFLTSTIQAYFKFSSLGLVKDSDGKFKFNIHKIINNLTEQPTRLTSSIFTADNIDLKRMTRYNSNMSLNLENLSPNISGSTFSLLKNKQPDQKPVELIEIFSENLDFCLKVLKHEKILIREIYSKSKETQNELISKLTLLVVEEIKKECEIFFKNSLDFTKFTNISDNVISSITRLKIKIKHLIETTSCIQTSDLASGFSIIQFSLRINEIASQIFQTYLSVVQTGYLNTSNVPNNSALHPYCVKICDTWAFIRDNESFVVDSIMLTCDSIENAKKKRQSKTIDSDLSDRWYCAKYYSFLIEKLDNFLIDCTVKFCESSKFNFITPSSSINVSVSTSFVKHMKSLKGFVFLVNNLAFIFDYIYELNLIDDLKKINPTFEDVMKENIENNIINSIQVFKYLKSKWSKLASEQEQILSESQTSLKSILKRSNSTDDKLKRKQEYLFYLKEAILNSFCLVIQNEAINKIYKEKSFEHLKPVLEWMDLNGELKSFFYSLNIKYNIENSTSIIDVLYEHMFPLDSLNQLYKLV